MPSKGGGQAKGGRGTGGARGNKGKGKATVSSPLRRPAPPRWLWPLVIAGILAAGLLVVVAVRGGGSTPVGPEPEGTEKFAEKAGDHVETPVTYDHNPPAGGPHSQRWQTCGVYDQPIRNENAVHSLEHGAVWVTYDPALPGDQVQALRQLVTSKYKGKERYVLLSPFPGLPAQVVASAWGAQIKLQSATDPKLAQFVDHFAASPQAPEPGASCSGGVGSPVG